MSNLKIQTENGNPEDIRSKLETLIRNFKEELKSDNLRRKVVSLIPLFHTLRNLGKSLVDDSISARDRILAYLLKYPRTVVDGDELLVVAGISEYARRIRELRVQFGWAIASGVTITEMNDIEEDISSYFQNMKPSQYILLRPIQDREAAHRWYLANSIRKQGGAVRDKILAFLRSNIGKEVTNEELRYVSGNKMEWARRVRELRTELGWPIATKTTGRPDLDIGIYVLQANRQSPKHDRTIKDDVRREVLRRDNYSCTSCGWSHQEWNPSDPRHLECHHVKAHVEGGGNIQTNLITLCNVCHDKIHRS